MMNTRKFWLINALGNKFDLSDEEAKFSLVSPKGLGFEKNIEVDKNGSREKLLSEELSNIDVTGELWFYDAGNGVLYEKYREFIGFIKYKPLELHYLPPNDIGGFYAKVAITKLEKEEIKKEKYMACPIVFHRLTQWLDNQEHIISVSNVSTDTGKSYPLERPYHYAGNSLSNILYSNNGTEDCGFIFTINGEVINPQLSIYNSLGEISGKLKLDGTFDYVRIDSNEDAYTMELSYNGTVLSNPENYQDLSIADGNIDVTWLKLAVGVNNRAVFTCGNLASFSGTVNFIYRDAFATV